MDLVQVVVSGLLLGGVYALFAAGLNMIFGVMRVINLAHGELMMLGAYISFWLFTLYGVNPLVSIPISAGGMFLLGLLLQRALIERVIGQPLLASLLLTFGLSTLFAGVALYLWTADFRSVPYLSGAVQAGPLVLSKSRLVASIIALALTGLTFAFLRYSTFGKTIRATSQHPQLAQVCGINVARVRLATFGIGSALAAASGALIVIIFPIYPEVGRLFLAKGFAVVVLGGLGSFVGAFIGGLILGVAETLTAFRASAQLAEAVAWAVLVLVLLVRPSGLFGVRE